MEFSEAENKKQGRQAKNMHFLQPNLKEKEVHEYAQKNSNQSNKTLKLVVNVGRPNEAAVKPTSFKERIDQEEAIS